MFPTTVERVPMNTADRINARIRQTTAENVARYGNAGDRQIEIRLQELDEEWDTERTLEANASTISLIGLGLGAFVDRRFLALPALVAGFLLQHAVQGWCPPLPILRRLGIRTQAEIERERYALKAMRGDFNEVPIAAEESIHAHTQAALEAVRKPS